MFKFCSAHLRLAEMWGGVRDMHHKIVWPPWRAWVNTNNTKDSARVGTRVYYMYTVAHTGSTQYPGTYYI
jgi:hypothetical protein